MMYFNCQHSQDNGRSGTVLVMFAICLIALMGLMALVIDGGLLRAEHFRVQAAADAAARAGAVQLYQNYSTNQGIDTNGSAAKGALAMALDNGYVNDGVDSTIVVNIPPKAGLYIGRAGFVEVLITSRQRRYFSNVWSSEPLYVSARAVARGAWVASNPSILLLDTEDKGAVSIKGNGAFKATGAPAVINSNSSSALAVSGGGSFDVGAVDITGGYSGSGITGTITMGVHPMPDPLAYLPAPGETGAPPIPSIMPTPVSVNNQYDLYPGSYYDLSFKSGDKVIFHQASCNANGGIFYLANGGLAINGAEVVMATGETGGVMIYNAGTDSGDAISITGNKDTKITLSALSDGPYAGLVVFQSRTMTEDLKIVGNGTLVLTGTIYAPAAHVHVTGNGIVSDDKMGSQWIARELFLGGNGGMSISYTPTTVARTRIIAIVE